MQIPKEQLPIIEQMLNLDDVKVLSAEIKEQEIELHAESKGNHSICHQCGQKATEFHCHGESRRLRHLSICGRPVYLVLRAKRYRCVHCADQPCPFGDAA
ncbi:MAG: transposase family protein [Blastocatellia bacterium]